MKALILVGGYGTRLRPLTFTIPKPLVDFCNKPLVLHQIEALAKVGVKHVILAVNYQPEVMVAQIKKYEEEYNIKITFSVESEPLGTAGPLAMAREHLTVDSDPFFVLNSDVVCEFPFAKLLEFHRAHGGEGTIMVTRVEDPSKFGVVLNKPGSSAIQRFVEKPKEFVGDCVNAGIYIFNTTVLDRIELRPMSIETEVFPGMARDGQLHSLVLEGFWADVGQPKDFLTGTTLYLGSLRKKTPELLAASADGIEIIGNVLIHPSATVGKGCKLGPDVVIGQNSVVGNGVRLNRTVVMPNATVKECAFVKSSIVGWHSSVGRWARLDNVCVLGEDVHVGDEYFVNGGSILPHKSVSKNIMEPQIVM
ncbi:mannose-1-phosphate guanyltransferase Mpg1 [Cladochytrium replicatum]|nr:mannose-1-phosphate guanyltransferase Mpg1 [Cladochytrium replicatum]